MKGLEPEWSNQHTIVFDIRLLSIIYAEKKFSTCIGYFFIINYNTTQHWCHEVHYSSEQISKIFIFK